MNRYDELRDKRHRRELANISRCTCGAWAWIPRGHCTTCGEPVEKHGKETA